MPPTTVPLTLRAPSAAPRHPLLAGLLDDARHPGTRGAVAAGLVHGAPVVRASRLVAGTTGIAVDLDVDPDSLPAEFRRRPGAVRHEVAPKRSDLADVLAIGSSSRHGDLPLVVFLAPGPWLLVDLGAVLAAGHRPGLVAEAGVGDVSDFLAVLTHAEVPFVARADDALAVLSLLAATVASLRGGDVAEACRVPDVAALAALSDNAGAAVRTVLGSIEVPDPAGVAEDLVAAGLTDAGATG